MNLLLAVFNLLPVPPLDGSSAVVLLLSKENKPRYQELLWSHPQLALVGIFIAWQVFDLLFDPIFTFSLNLLYFFEGTSYS